MFNIIWVGILLTCNFLLYNFFGKCKCIHVLWFWHILNPVIPYRNEPKGIPKETNAGDCHLFPWAPLSSKFPFSWIPLNSFVICQLYTDPCSYSNLPNCPRIHAAAPVISRPCSARIVWKVYVGFTILGKYVNKLLILT